MPAQGPEISVGAMDPMAQAIAMLGATRAPVPSPSEGPPEPAPYQPEWDPLRFVVQDPLGLARQDPLRLGRLASQDPLQVGLGPVSDQPSRIPSARRARSLRHSTVVGRRPGE